MYLRVKQSPTLRALTNPEQGLRTLVGHAPQAEAWADRTKEKLRPTVTVLYAIRRRLATGAVAVVTVWLFVHVMFGANGMVVYRKKKTEYEALQQQIGNLKKENDRYGQQIDSLQHDPKTIEKEAREQLHYARPGEVVYVSPPSGNPQRPEVNAARK
jgi:cell division protein FtsB